MQVVPLNRATDIYVGAKTEMNMLVFVISHRLVENILNMR